MDEKFLNKIVELQNLFDEGVLTTADKIPQPETRQDVEEIEAINAFMKRNPRADGGRIGFAEGPPNVRGAVANLARRMDSINELYNMYGKSNVDKAFKAKHGIALQEIAKKTTHSYKGKESKVTDLISNFKRKFIREGGKFLTEEESRIKSRKKRAFKEADLQIKLLEATNKDEFFDPKKFAKENDISLAKVKNEAKKLQKNIYVKRMLESGKENISRKLEWLPNDVNLADNALDKLYKSKLIKYERDKIDNLFYDAFGREFIQGTKKKNPTYNPKKFLAIKDQLNKYRKLKKAIQLKYPNINFELDHPLSKSTIRNLFNASAADLTRVNVLTEDLNKGFKDSLSQKYYKAVTGDNLKQKQAVEKIAKDLNLNIGRISNLPGKFNFGVKEFQKLNLQDEILKAAQTRADLSSNFKNYVKNNPELFKAAKIKPNIDLAPVTQKEIKGIEKILKSEGPTLGANINLLKGLSEAFKAVPTPTATALITGALGVDPTSAIDRASIGAEAALAPQLVKQVSKITSNPIYQRFLNLGLSPTAAMRVARVASPIGLASLIGEATVKGAKDTMAAAKQIDAIQDQDLQRQEYDNLIRNIVGYAGGGIAKLAGDPSGPPPEAGPNSQGLSSLMKRGTNI
jgi:hypothetical protein